MWPWSAAVCQQCRCSSYGWCTQMQIWPCHTVAEGLTVAACTWVDHFTNCAFWYTIASTVWRRATSYRTLFILSADVCVLVCPAGTGTMTFYTRWPSLLRHWTSAMEQSTTLQHWLHIIQYFWEIPYDFSILPVILERGTLALDCVKHPCSSCCCLRRAIIDMFTLHYLPIDGDPSQY